MKTLLIYDDLVALNRDQHRHLKLAPPSQPFAFARGTNSVLIAASELPLAALDFPCVFVEAADGHSLAALVGLRDHENLFVQPDGHWARGSYLPAFFRRYPFVLAEAEGSDTFTVCLDRASPGLGTDQGQALFDDDGGETPWLEEVKRFLLNFRQEMQVSRDFANHLAALELLQDGVIEYTLDGEKSTLRGFKTVNEAKLRSLDAAALQDLAARGWLGWAYAHLLSIQQVQRLALRLDERRTLDKAERDAAPATH
ncbi:SapC family protein [Pelomonas cellulosilytica]|uniref:SapC family protein n=1 Tax=Pelomonas cellulosilytica TaxID=2906762 RepID=A0ABS8XXH8_9BURK|nr:SapC family protein [Pelomonas sp. P8]MCE4555481.1 SapC family protein [Pelomonas sp. P8]